MEKFIYFLAIYTPFQLALNPTKGIDLASIRVLAIALFLFWLAQGLRRKKISIKNTLQTWLVVAFLFLNLFSIIVAKNTDWSLRKLLFLFSIIPIYFVIVDIIDNRQKAVKLIKSFILGGVLMAFTGIVQFFMQFLIGMDATYKFWANEVIAPFLGESFSEAVLANPSWLVNISGKTYLRATALFPDPHMFSFFLGLLIPLALGLWLSEKRKKFLWMVILFILITADLLTFSRGGYVGLFSGAIFTAILFWKELEKKYKNIALIAVSLIILSLLFSNPISERFYSSFDFKEGSNMGRIEIWNKAIKTIENNPLVGVGVGNYPLTVKATASYREPIYAHNTYLDIAVETGLINAFIWVSLLGIVFFEFYNKGRKNKLFLMGAVSVVIFFIHSLVETAIYSPVVLMLLISIIGLSNINLKNSPH